MSPGLPGWLLPAALVLLAGLIGLALRRLARRRRRRPGAQLARKPPRRSGTSGSLGNAFLSVHALLEPDRRHVIEIRRSEQSESDESGEPPEPGPR